MYPFTSECGRITVLSNFNSISFNVYEITKNDNLFDGGSKRSRQDLLT